MITPKLQHYIEQYILPQYEHYDKGHNLEHIEQVIAGALELAALQPELSMDIIYTAAAYHDLGLIEGRETHHFTSARMLREDEFMQSFFSAEDREVIAQAIEDHRASSKSDPRSAYGNILSSADRIIDADTIIRRSYYHTLKYHPEYNLDENIARIYDHICDKYGKGGYLRIPILTERNKQGLATLHKLIENKTAFIAHATRLIEALGA